MPLYKPTTATVVALALLVVGGCGEVQRRSAAVPDSEALLAATTDQAVSNDVSPSATVPSDAPTTEGGLHRKIIYSAQIELLAENLDEASTLLVALVKRHGAYVADSQQGGTSGETRHARWRIRVPVTHFEEFVDTAKTLGELQSVRTESQDKSEEYYDIEARRRNKAREEERLLKLLGEHPGKLDEVMAIERALSQSREEVERWQGRLRVLDDLTALTTVTITITEVHGYAPPQNPTFTARVERAFNGSLSTLLAAGEDTCVAAAIVAPWLGMLVLLAYPFYSLSRTMQRRRARRDPPGA